MLITSSSWRGKCPICGAANCACGGPSNVIPVDERTTRAGAGPLRLYQLGPGRFVQLTDDAARARGLLPPAEAEARLRRERKMREQASNKMVRSAPNKAADRGRG